MTDTDSGLHCCKETASWICFEICTVELLYNRVPLVQQHPGGKALQARCGQAGGFSRRSRLWTAACLSDPKQGFSCKHASYWAAKAPSLALRVLPPFYWRRRSGRIEEPTKCFVSNTGRNRWRDRALQRTKHSWRRRVSALKKSSIFENKNIPGFTAIN